MNKLSMNDIIKNKIKDNKNNLSISSLTTNKKLKPTNITEDLIESKNQRREKLLQVYLDLYYNCVEQIKYNDILAQTDIVFVVPILVKGLYEYNSVDCLNFIEKRLREAFIDTSILSNVAIFITWKYIETNQYNSTKN